MKIVVTGANGQLATQLKNSDTSDNIDISFMSRSELDITRYDELRKYCEQGGFEAIINCAAYTNVRMAESSFSDAVLVNSSAVLNLGLVSKEFKIKLIHVSTDYVFSGDFKTPISEKARPEPLNTYGFSKLLGEEILQRMNLQNSLIIRISWVFSTHGQNFLNTIIKLSKSKNELKIVSDQFGSPTYTKDIAPVLIQLAKNHISEFTEVYHLSNRGQCSWFEFAEYTLKKFNSTARLVAISSEQLEDEVQRPAYTVLSTKKIYKDYNIRLRHWKDAVDDFIENHKSNLEHFVV